MGLLPAWSQICPYGRTFSVPQVYTYHKRSCKKTKKWLSGTLEKAKEVWWAKKRQKVDNEALTCSSNTNAIPKSSPTNYVPTTVAQNVTVSSYSNIFPCYIEYLIFNQSTVNSGLVPMDID
jgi:hypothetical protein